MKPNKNIIKFMQAVGEHCALTFDDVVLVPQYSEILPNEVNLKTKLTRNISLNVPFISAAMDTVTESKMAIAMALMGGIGIIHKNLSPEKQSSEVKKVKYFLNGFLEKVRVAYPHQTLKELYKYKKEKGFSFSSFPIVDENRRLLGIITSKELKYEDDLNTQIKDIMNNNPIYIDRICSLEEAYEIMKKNKINILPVVINGKLKGIFCWKDVKDIVKSKHPLYNRDKKHRLRCGAAVSPKDYERVESLVESNVDVIVVDTAHGHSKGVIDMVKWIKENYDVDVIAGNIANPEAVKPLMDVGADAIKVGIGPGSICTTRVITGVGIPQITAIYECALASEGKIPIIADGGIKYSGDVAKAIAAGADCVMMGNVFAGTDESPGEKILYEGRKYVIYRGMGSLEAMRERKGSRERYGQQYVEEDKLVPEGVVGRIPYAGSVKDVLIQFIGGLKNSFGYLGARNIEEFNQKAIFKLITGAGLRENHPHDIVLEKDAPNYKKLN